MILNGGHYCYLDEKIELDSGLGEPEPGCCGYFKLITMDNCLDIKERRGDTRAICFICRTHYSFTFQKRELGVLRAALSI